MKKFYFTVAICAFIFLPVQAGKKTWLIYDAVVIDYMHYLNAPDWRAIPDHMTDAFVKLIKEKKMRSITDSVYHFFDIHRLLGSGADIIIIPFIITDYNRYEIQIYKLRMPRNGITDVNQMDIIGFYNTFIPLKGTGLAKAVAQKTRQAFQQFLTDTIYGGDVNSRLYDKLILYESRWLMKKKTEEKEVVIPLMVKDNFSVFSLNSAVDVIMQLIETVDYVNRVGVSDEGFKYFKIDVKRYEGLKNSYPHTYNLLLLADAIARKKYQDQTINPGEDQKLSILLEVLVREMEALYSGQYIGSHEASLWRKKLPLGYYEAVMKFRDMYGFLNGNCYTLIAEADSLVKAKKFTDAKLKYLDIEKNCSRERAGKAIAGITMLQYHRRDSLLFKMDSLVQKKKYDRAKALATEADVDLYKRFPDLFPQPPQELNAENLRRLVNSAKTAPGTRMMRWVWEDAMALYVEMSLDTSEVFSIIQQFYNFPLGKPDFIGEEKYFQSIFNVIKLIIDTYHIVPDNNQFKVNITGCSDATPFRGAYHSPFRIAPDAPVKVLKPRGMEGISVYHELPNDATGFNLKLSYDRALICKNYLRSKGVISNPQLFLKADSAKGKLHRNVTVRLVISKLPT